MEFKNARRHPRRPRPDISQPVAPASRPAPQPVLAPVPAALATTPPPKMRLISRGREFLPKSKKTTGIFAGAVVAVCLVAGLAVYNSSHKSRPEAKSPAYQTVLPAGKPISKLGGWKRVSPPGKEPVFAYADTIGGVAVSVSQQPLPQAFKDDTDGQVAELAKKFNATDKLDAGTTTAYIGTSAKGPQSVIFAKGSTLVLIKSQKKISDKAWTQYIASLR